MKTYSPTAIWFSGDYMGDMEEDENGEWVSHADAQAEIDRLRSLLIRFNRELRLMALLAADSPQFFNPLDAIEAKQIRDNILSLPNDQTNRPPSGGPVQ